MNLASTVMEKLKFQDIFHKNALGYQIRTCRKVGQGICKKLVNLL